ncbi:rhomboid family intramembrane serine protease [candidate division KSB1 bacterium]|nr:rhomboid family intramembrane serine protease [candidate division KSB1 bacterium]
MQLNSKKHGSMICPNCNRLIGINATECIYCGYKQPAMWGFAPFLKNILVKFDLVKGVILFCAGIFILSLLLDPSKISFSISFFDFLSPDTLSLYNLGATGSIAIREGRWWTLITAIFLHGNILHIAMNMLWVRQLWIAVQDLFGASRVIIIFIFAGFLGFVFSTIWNINVPHVTLGASGSLFGLLGALIAYGRKRGGSFGQAIYQQMLYYAVILLFMGFMMPRVDNSAHIGGFIGGYLGALMLGFNEFRPETRWHNLIALGLILLTLFSFGFNIYLIILAKF